MVSCYPFRKLMLTALHKSTLCLPLNRIKHEVNTNVSSHRDMKCSLWGSHRTDCCRETVGDEDFVKRPHSRNIFRLIMYRGLDGCYWVLLRQTCVQTTTTRFISKLSDNNVGPRMKLGFLLLYFVWYFPNTIQMWISLMQPSLQKLNYCCEYPCFNPSGTVWPSPPLSVSATLSLWWGWGWKPLGTPHSSAHFTSSRPTALGPDCSRAGLNTEGRMGSRHTFIPHRSRVYVQTPSPGRVTQALLLSDTSSSQGFPLLLENDRQL